MDVSHIMVGALTAVTIVLLVWAEIRSRRNTAAMEGNSAPSSLEQQVRPASGNGKRGRIA